MTTMGEVRVLQYSSLYPINVKRVEGSSSNAQSYLQNPYYFMFASLAKPDDDAELHWLKVCPTPPSFFVVLLFSLLYHLFVSLAFPPLFHRGPRLPVSLQIPLISSPVTIDAIGRATSHYNLSGKLKDLLWLRYHCFVTIDTFCEFIFTIHLQDGKTRCTTGSVVSSLYHLKDTEHNNEDAGFFVFPDLSVRTEGSYR